jgi:hypothetical protein
MTCVVMRVIACRPGLALHLGSYSCVFEFGCAVCVGWFLQQQIVGELYIRGPDNWPSIKAEESSSPKDPSITIIPLCR